MAPETLPPKRRRGAQPGNTNALKHGLFSRRVNPADLYRLGANPGYARDCQIAQLRLYLKELFDRGLHIDNFSDYLALLKNINEATAVLTRFLREKRSIEAPQADLDAAVSLIIVQYLLDGHRKSKQPPPPGPSGPDPDSN